MWTRIIFMLIVVVIVAGLLGFGIGVSSMGNRELGSGVLAVAFVIGLFALVFS